MTEDIYELLQQHHAFYEVLPYYEVVEELTRGTAVTRRRIQAGFDIDVYGVKDSRARRPGRDYAVVCAALEKLVISIMPHTGESPSVEVIPFDSTVVFDTKRHFQQEGMLRIRIRHRGLGQLAGTPEERVLHELKECLHQLGLSQRTI